MYSIPHALQNIIFVFFISVEHKRQNIKTAYRIQHN